MIRHNARETSRALLAEAHRGVAAIHAAVIAAGEHTTAIVQANAPRDTGEYAEHQIEVEFESAFGVMSAHIGSNDPKALLRHQRRSRRLRVRIQNPSIRWPATGSRPHPESIDWVHPRLIEQPSPVTIRDRAAHVEAPDPFYVFDGFGASPRN